MKKHVPEVISMIVVPFFSLVPAVLLAHTVIGPFGRMIGDGLAKIIQIGFDSSFSWIVSGIYGLCYPLMVITGLHHAMLPIDLQAAEVVGGIYTFPVVALNNIAHSVYTDKIETTAYKREDGSIAVVCLNRTEKQLPVHLRINKKTAEFTLLPQSVTTCEISDL